MKNVKLLSAALLLLFGSLVGSVGSAQFPPDFLSENGFLLDESAPPSLVSGVLEIPNGVKWMLIGFQFLNAGDSDWLSVHFRDRLLFSIDGNDISNSLEPMAALIDVSEFAGSTDSLTFILNSVGQVNAQVVISESPVFFNPTSFVIDDLSVVRNGTPLFNDPFDDGSPPPSAPNFLNGASASYSVTGIFRSESNGKLELNVADGEDSVTPTGRPARIQSARLLTSTNPASSRNLGPDATFEVSGVFDLILPRANSEAFRINLTDRTQPQGPGDTTNDAIRLGVERSERDRPTCRDPITSQPVGAAQGEVIIRLSKSDFVLDSSVTLDCFKMNLAGDPDQIQLTLAKTNPATNEITGSFTYLKHGFEISTTTFIDKATIFNGGVLPDGTPFPAEQHTRPQFDTFFIPGVPTPEFGVQLTTGSPVSISQNVTTPASPFTLDFFYEFKTTTVR